ncbi:hypothetical protein OAG51_02935 [Pirellulaceae bacterium]|nr:hypothetical protein [Mariniblastus sp.]MDB4755829.1 hypothetical protein [Mariniblastus sp.]MDB4794356.1 hypothetical protein [Pirellulaceae bacterium]
MTVIPSNDAGGSDPRGKDVSRTPKTKSLLWDGGPAVPDEICLKAGSSQKDQSG